jgi:hypothetical protein
MKKIKATFRLIVTLLLVGGWALAASALHVVWTGDPKKPVIVPKDRIGAAETYVNVQHWTANDVAAHPIIVGRLIETGHADVLAHAFKDESGQAVTGDALVAAIEDAVKRGPTTQPAPEAAPAPAAEEATTSASAEPHQ